LGSVLKAEPRPSLACRFRRSYPLPEGVAPARAPLLDGASDQRHAAWLTESFLMTRFATVATLAFALLAGNGAQAPASPPDGLVWMALSEINGFYDNLDDPTDRPPLLKRVPAGMIVPVDVSHDGKTDWLLDFDKAGVSAFCGTGGCPKRLYVSDQTGYVRAFDQQVLDLAFRDVGQETRIEARVHHTNCDPQAPDCLYAFAWDRRAGRLMPRPASDGATLLAGGGFAPVDIKASDVVGVIYDWARGQRRVCVNSDGEGFETRQAILTALPDINGDGLVDWLGAPSRPCDGAETPGFLVWTSGDADAFQLTYTSAPEHWARLDIGPSPARLLEGADCEAVSGCVAQTLSWDPVEARLILRTAP